MEVTNSWAHSSHDQAWRMRPLKLNADSSAISRTLSQRGHFGRLKSYLTGFGALQANWTVIVEPPRRPLTHPDLSRYFLYDEGSVWRRYDAIMKLSWPRPADFGLSREPRWRNLRKTAGSAQVPQFAHIWGRMAALLR